MNDTFSYDLVDYPPLIHAAMQPAKLAAIGRLHGIAAASPQQCHLLEVGCGDALQLLALAQAYPDAEFVGVDMSVNAIARGQELSTQLGLRNLRLIAADITTWDPGHRPFDYIVTHGFFSWVPGAVRECLLGLCGTALAPAGIAYISYNAMPGCHLRQMMWEMMKFHVRDITDPPERLRKARDFLIWMGTDAMERGGYGQAIRHEARHLLSHTQLAVLYHDDLSSINEPFSVTGFMQQCRPHGLEFLAEADYHETNPALLSPEELERFKAMCGPDPIANDQHLDFLKGRRFRQTLLCRTEAASLGAAPHPDAIRDFDVIGHIRSEAVTGKDTGTMRFASSDGAALSTNHTVVKAALLEVSDAFPHPCRVADLLQSARKTTKSTASHDDDAEALRHVLFKGFELGLLSLEVDSPRFAATASEFPKSSPLARAQAERGVELVANLRPSMVSLDSKAANELLRLLDGSRNRDALLHDLCARMALHPVAPDGEAEPSLRDAAWWREQLGPTLDDALRLCARNSLLLQD